MTYSKEEQKEYYRKWYQKNKEKKQEQNREWYRKNKEKRTEQIKGYHLENIERRYLCRTERKRKMKIECIEYLGGKCVVCGATERLEFDHIKREGKKYEISAKLSYKFDNLKEELDKCQLLCYDCHKIKTKSERTILCKMKPTQRGD